MNAPPNKTPVRADDATGADGAIHDAEKNNAAKSKRQTRGLCNTCGGYHRAHPDRKTPIIGYRGKFPLIAGTITEHQQIVFWCQWCQRTHYHGTGRDKNDFRPEAVLWGHRGAHCCRAVSPFYETGYYLVDAEKELL
jgi:hypothetical protein